MAWLQLARDRVSRHPNLRMIPLASEPCREIGTKLVRTPELHEERGHEKTPPERGFFA
jgi:hypothetical protein